MKSAFELVDGSIIPSAGGRIDVNVYVAPGEEEKREIADVIGLDPHDIESALDPDEISRVQFYPEGVYVIWKRPKNLSVDQRLRLDVTSAGLFYNRGMLNVIMSESGIPFSAKEFQGVSSTVDVLLKFFLHTVHHYLDHLKAIKQLTADLESKISTSMENRYLLQMFALGEALIYYLNAIEANGSTLAKVRASAEKLGLTKEQTEMLDDIILDNYQCAKQAQIFTTVLSGLMDARGTIVNNNVNVLLKNLTLINIIFLPLNLIASIGGMSEFSAFTKNVGWKISYSLFSLGMVLLGWATWVLLVRAIDKKQRAENRIKR